MQEVAAEPGRRPPGQQQFVGVDLRRPKGYAAPATGVAATEGDPCPRCESRDTKFCYYNNYNTSQPRHFCKGCRRYWTKGGTLRNVPVGGGTRKKPSPSSSYAAAASADSKPPKKPSKKKRRVAPAAPEPDSAAKTTAAEAEAEAAAATTETTTTTTDAASEVTTELVAPAAAATVDEDSLAHLLQPDDAAAVALGLGLSDFPAGKGLLDMEPDSFEWPASFDLGACWGGGGFGDPDPAGLFLNLP